ncbi:hypothetical protein Pan97_16230 [Bremerella volcania]|uniref:BON domain protein n=1 Tax=Bremerella volcania TaxID=2527984 RepID=A0A518C5X7_9BACT|nr:hypothetical protein [Bremerella volcania]QDU74594.1 hypothetical protein Pan97_16040 [Bremerella volcania]QDU74612.1 hypothetical protein Pan97_16230 [Bremerella volcania]
MIEILVERPADTNGSAKIQRRAGTSRRKQTKSIERNGTPQTTASVAAVQREHEQVIEAQASAELRTSSYHAVRNVSCEVCECVLILRGRVPSFYMKQIAQTVVRHLLDGNLVIDNQLEMEVDRA